MRATASLIYYMVQDGDAGCGNGEIFHKVLTMKGDSVKISPPYLAYPAETRIFVLRNNNTS